MADHAALNHLSSRVYEHRFDTQALESIKKIPGVDGVLKALIKESYERANRLFHKANTVAVTSKQLPHLYQLFLHAAYRLAIENIPDICFAIANGKRLYHLVKRKTVCGHDIGVTPN